MATLREHILTALQFIRATVTAVPHTSRSLRRAPAFVAVAALSLGAALGMSTAVFAFIDAMRHPESPYRDAAHLYEVRIFGNARVSPSVQEVREALAGISAIARVASMSISYDDVEAGESVNKVPVAHPREGFFDVLQPKLRFGRLPTAGEAQTGSAALVSDEFWRAHFRTRTDLTGAQLTIDERPYAIIGVIAANSEVMLGTSVWIPDVEGSTRAYGVPYVRLKPDASVAQAQAQLNAAMQRLTVEYVHPGEQAFHGSFVSLEVDPLTLRDFHKAMIAGAVCVLLIACANVAALMLARGTVRRRDYALRLALGASRADIAREVLIEVTALALIGCVGGAIIATWVVGLMTAATPVEMKWYGFSTPQWSLRVLGTSALAVLGAVAVAGGVPAWRASRTDPAGTLKDSSGGSTGRARTQFRWLVIAELAMSMALMVGASLMLKSVVLMARYDFGVDTDRLITAHAYSFGLPRTAQPAEYAQIGRDALARLRTTPGVETAAMVSSCVFDHPMVTTDRTVEGAQAATLPQCLNVSSQYLGTVGYAIVAGRDFEDGDVLGAGAAILDERTAHALFPHDNPIGRTLKLGNLASHKAWLPVVGIVRNRSVGFNPFPERGADTTQTIFVSTPDSTRDAHDFVIRTAAGAHNVRVAVAHTLHDVLPRRAFTHIAPWTETYDRQLAEERFLTIIFSLLGATSLLLGAAGLFSVVSYITGQRMREFAVRVALGATRDNVAGLVLREAFLMALGGTAIGAGLGMWGGFLIWDKMYGVYPVDVTALLAAEVTLVVVTMAGCLAPALRATKANPVEVMRAV